MRKMGLFNPQSREEQARYVYHENARFREHLRGNKRKIGNLTTPDFWPDVICVGMASPLELDYPNGAHRLICLFLAVFAFSSYSYMVVEKKRILWYNKYISRVAYIIAI